MKELKTHIDQDGRGDRKTGEVITIFDVYASKGSWA
jgi:hypothetical protein